MKSFNMEISTCGNLFYPNYEHYCSFREAYIIQLMKLIADIVKRNSFKIETCVCVITQIRCYRGLWSLKK